MDLYCPRVLIVDDQPDNADSLAKLVNLWGYDGEARYSGATALGSVRAQRPAVVLLDLEMPGMSGFEFVLRLRETRGGEQIAVIAISGHTTRSCRARARELGIDHYLFKPANLVQLRELVERLCATSEPVEVRTRSQRHEVLDCLTVGV